MTGLKLAKGMPGTIPYTLESEGHESGSSMPAQVMEELLRRLDWTHIDGSWEAEGIRVDDKYVLNPDD